MELEVGMYARLFGKIGKIVKLCDCEQCEARGYYEPIIEYAHNERDYVCRYWKDDLKASHNIKDLIAVGDIIKFDITDTDNYAEIQGYNCWEISCEEELNGVKEMIEMGSAKLLSIVTKEQFESMQYRIGE